MSVERWAGEWADEILGRPPQSLGQRRWFGPPPELPHESEAHALASEFPWTWQEIRDVLELLHGDTATAKVALRIAAAMGMTPSDAARQLKAFQGGDDA